MEYEYLFTDRKRIGNNIEAIMKDRRCTKVTLSQAMNMSRPTLDAFLKGDIHNTNKYDEYIRRLLAYMQISESVLDNYKSLPDVKKMRCNNVNKSTVKATFENQLIYVVSATSYEECMKAVKAQVANGNKVVAISALCKDAFKVISDVADECKDVVIGITDVSTKEQASVAVDCGAEFIVAVSSYEEIGVFSKARDVFCMMCASTINECYNVLAQGTDAICLYPVETISDVMINTIKRLLPDENLVTMSYGKYNSNQDFYAGLYL